MLAKKYSKLEKLIISKDDRFLLNRKQNDELKKNFDESIILVTGAAGSIGSRFVERLINYNFKRLILIDKDENQLTELNREFVLTMKKEKLLKTSFVCTDLNSFDLKNFLITNSISHYLNFAAVKHVRSEEEVESIKYMFNTNSYRFLPFIRISSKNKLKHVFSISTDKVANPTSLLGISKAIMEQRLIEFSMANKNIHVSTVRFANVSFSNGSVLKYIDDRIRDNKVYGIPSNVSRYFITHEEASSLCLKSLLKINDKNILIPSENFFKKIENIKDLSEKILKSYKLKAVYTKKFKYNKNEYYVKLNDEYTHGQKNYEEFYGKNEKVVKKLNDKNLHQIKFKYFLNTLIYINKFLKIKNRKDAIKVAKTIYSQFNEYDKVIPVSKII